MANTDPAAVVPGNVGGGGGRGGGGMSRAAMKRAKKRARKEQANDNNNNNAANNNASSSMPAATVGAANADRSGAKSNADGGEDSIGAAQYSGKEKKKKKKRSERKGEMAAKAVPAAKEEAESMDAGNIDSATEMEPELEALLSTLTPLQILMLDGKDEHPDEKPAPEEDPLEINGVQNNDDANDEGTPLAGIDPLQIVGDLTTEHRARILLSSLLAPSGVTLRQFYEQYWGERPLLACLDQVEDDGENADRADRYGKEGNGEKEDEAVAAQHSARLDGFLNRRIVEDMIRKNKLRYGLDLNVTRFTDATGSGARHRITLDPPPKKRKKTKGMAGDDDLEHAVANPKDVWSNVDGSRCSVRLLRPHEHDDNVHSLLSLLESEFGCMVGSNAYLTPLNSQGFAPHYDDVDVFILQLEGYKRWKVYAPFNKLETLPRESSRDYSEKEVEENCEGPYMDEVLGPGDLLYLPRGWIHQAETVARPPNLPKLPGLKDDHSLHLTVSAMQNWCWADFLETLMPEALESAAASDKSTSLREGLPRNFLSYMGTMHQTIGEDGQGDDAPEGLKQAAEAQAQAARADVESQDEEALAEAAARRRTAARQRRFKDEAKKRIMRVCKQAVAMLDDACDQIGKRFLSDRLPPALLEPERCLTKEAPSASSHHDSSRKIWPNTLCRLVRPSVARLVVEDDKAVLYHCLDNSRVYHGTPVSPMEFEIDDAPALEQLLTTVEPHWIMVNDLIHGDVEDKMGIAQALFDEGLLATVLMETPDRSVQTG